MEHEVCKGCKWNNYPLCNGTIVDGIKMNIEKLNIGFQCGVKDRESPYIYSKIPQKSDLELKIEELQNQINKLKEK